MNWKVEKREREKKNSCS